jgi:hypothetical protein
VLQCTWRQLTTRNFNLLQEIDLHKLLYMSMKTAPARDCGQTLRLCATINTFRSECVAPLIARGTTND